MVLDLSLTFPVMLAAPMEGSWLRGLLCARRISLEDMDLVKAAAHDRPHCASPTMSQPLAITSRQDTWSACLILLLFDSSAIDLLATASVFLGPPSFPVIMLSSLVCQTQS